MDMKKMYVSLECGACGLDPEIQEHILECEKLCEKEIIIIMIIKSLIMELFLKNFILPKNLEKTMIDLKRIMMKDSFNPYGTM